MCFFGSVFFVFLVYAVVVMSFLGAEFIRLFTIKADHSCMTFQGTLSRKQTIRKI